MHRYLLLILISMLHAVATFAQTSRADLEAKRKQINQKIEQTNKLLLQTKQTRSQALQQINQLQRQIKTRDQAISAISKEVQSIGNIIERKELIVEALQRDLDSLHQSYKLILTQLYRYQLSNPIQLAMLSPRYFQEIALYQQYLQRLEQQRHIQFRLISQTRWSIHERLTELQIQKNGKSSLLQSELNNKKQLTREVANKDQIAKNLQQKEKRLRDQLAANERNKQKLNSNIESVIRNEIAAAKSSARVYTTPKPNAPADAALAPLPKLNDADLTKRFAAQKGKMSMPARGTIISAYGRQLHPELPLVYVNNNGVDIKTSSNASVHAIFDGIVVSVFTIPSMGNAVMVKHGEYYTTYSNLAGVAVKRGATIRAGQKVGNVGKEIASGNFILHFELWKNKLKENPSAWCR